MKLYVSLKDIELLIDILCNDVDLIDEEEIRERKEKLISGLVHKLQKEEVKSNNQ